jgi:hypothetical protein
MYTYIKEILFIADGGSTNGDSLKNIWPVTLSVVLLVICLLIGGVIVYKSKEIFFSYFLAK